MSTKSIDQLISGLDQAVPPHGGPKVTAPALHAVLRDMLDTLAAPSTLPRVYEEVLHFPAQSLFQDTIFEASRLVSLTAGAGVARVELALGNGEFQLLLSVPATTYAPSPPLPLPVGPLTYRVTFADGVHYAALKQLIQVD